MTTDASSQQAEIPTIDFGPFLQDEGVVIGAPPTKDQVSVAKAIDEACRQHGFIHLVNFGVTQDLRQACFGSAKTLFSQNDDAWKRTHMARIKPQTNMGYAPFGSESLNRARPPELKEAFNVRFSPRHTNDYRGCPPSFVEAATKLQEVLKVAAKRYAMACALALDLPLDFFAKHLADFDLCTIRFLHAPPCAFHDANGSSNKNASNDTSLPVRVGEHTDFGIFTFLLLGEHGAEGLQLKRVLGGEVGGADAKDDMMVGWSDVVVPPGVGAIMNTGALMARWTNDTWTATAHRVIVGNQLAASRDRYSIACFVDPDRDCVVAAHDKFQDSEGGVKYEPMTSFDYLMMKLSEMMPKE